MASTASDFRQEILEEYSATKIQAFARMIIAKDVVQQLALEVYEKLFDAKQNAVYYFNSVTMESSWFKPKLLGSADISVDLDYNWYETEHYKKQRVKIFAVDLDVAAEGVNAAVELQIGHDSDEDEEYQVFDLPSTEAGGYCMERDEYPLTCHSSKRQAEKGHVGKDSALPPPPTSLYAPENKAVPEEEGEEDGDDDEGDGGAARETSEPEAFFGVEDFPPHYVHFQPYKSPHDTSLHGMRETYARLRSTGWKRVIRRKEIVAIDAAEEAMDTTDANVIRRAIILFEALKKRHGIATLSASLLRTVAEMKKWATKVGVLTQNGEFAVESAPVQFKPVCWRRPELMADKDIPTFMPAGDALAHLSEKMSVTSTYIAAVPPKKKKAVEAPKVLEGGETKAMGEEVARKVEHKAEGSKVPQSPSLSLGQPTEEEILEATTSLFACAGSETGELLRINVHHGPRDHLGERFVISSDPPVAPYQHMYSFMAFSFPFPGTIRYEVYLKMNPVMRVKIAAEIPSSMRHKPYSRKSGEDVAADDKQLGWGSPILTFYAYYGPQTSGITKYYIGDMYNPYRARITTSSFKGGWGSLGSFYAFPVTKYTVFRMTRRRAAPNDDEFVDVYRASRHSSLLGSNCGQYLWEPQFSFYGFDKPVLGSTEYRIHSRIDLDGASRISRESAHTTFIRDEDEEARIEWVEDAKFYAFTSPIRGTKKIFVQTASRPMRFKISMTLPEKPWRPAHYFFGFL